MRTLALTTAALLFAACSLESTSFRPTDRGDGSERDGPPAAAYDASFAKIYVWSTGGYYSNTDEPMTQIHFEIRNTSTAPVVFDGDALSLALFDASGTSIGPAAFVVVAPLGPAQVAIAPGATVLLDAYFALPVATRRVAAMHAQWAVTSGRVRRFEVTHFVRADEPGAPQLPGS
jgi:hypothetical protein